MFSWKVKRELKRIQQQATACAGMLYEPWMRYHHDKHREKLLKIIHGKQLFNSKIALLLIYQPKNLAESVYQTCKHLKSKGYAVLAICNHSLTEYDRKILLRHTWTIIERPNFGYDFGGYRDGILFLKHKQYDVSHLLVLNDSIWYPVVSNDTMIQRMEASNADYVGALSMNPNIINNNLDFLQSKKVPFFGSFFFMIKKTVYDSEMFTHYWKSYRSTSSKYLTIKRGERGFSKVLFNAGVTSDYLYDKVKLYDYIDSSDIQELLYLLKCAVTLDEKYSHTRKILLTYAKHRIDKRNKQPVAYQDLNLPEQSVFEEKKYKDIHIGVELNLNLKNNKNKTAHAVQQKTPIDTLIKTTELAESRFEQAMNQTFNQLDKHEEWVIETRLLLKAICSKQNILSTMPIIGLERFGVSYIKKSLDPHNRLALKKIAIENQSSNLNIDFNIITEITRSI